MQILGDFRNALVRANYSNNAKGIYMDTKYLETLFRNIMLDENFVIYKGHAKGGYWKILK